MKYFYNFITKTGILVIIFFQSEFVFSQTYDSDAAATYADSWACPESDPYKYNPAYGNYYMNLGGGVDCAYFVSQCLIEGGLDLSSGPELDYHYGTTCIVGCNGCRKKFDRIPKRNL